MRYFKWCHLERSAVERKAKAKIESDERRMASLSHIESKPNECVFLPNSEKHRNELLQNSN
jgi:hypothetical protein